MCVSGEGLQTNAHLDRYSASARRVSLVPRLAGKLGTRLAARPRNGVECVYRALQRCGSTRTHSKATVGRTAR